MVKGSLKIGLIVLIALLVTPARAQIDFGVRAGLARSSMTHKVDLDYHSGSRLGYSIAALADIPFYRRFSFRPQAAIVNQGGSFSSHYDLDGIPTYKYKGNYYSLQTYLNVAFNIPITGVRMAVFGGIVPDFHLGGKMDVIDLGDNLAPTAEKSMKFDLGVNGGISVEYKNVFFSIDILCGTLDRRIDKIKEESSVYHNNLTFSLGYFFR